jgi:hypothetical protein
LAENKEQTQMQGQIATVTLNGKDYKIDSFPDEQKVALGQIEQISQQIELAKIDVRNLEYAKQYLVDYLIQNTDKFEEVPQVSETEPETKKG